MSTLAEVYAEVPVLSPHKNDEANGPGGDLPVIAVLLPAKGLNLARTRDILIGRWNSANDMTKIAAAVLAGDVSDEILQLCGRVLANINLTQGTGGAYQP